MTLDGDWESHLKGWDLRPPIDAQVAPAAAPPRNSPTPPHAPHSCTAPTAARWPPPELLLALRSHGLARKFSEGEYTKKTWAHFDEVKAQLQNIHQAHSAEMRDALIF